MPNIIKTSEWILFSLLLLILGFSSIVLIFQIVPLPTDNISLPPPDLVGHLPLSSTIHQSKTSKNLCDYPLEIKEISQILWALQGITHGINKRTLPSAGATYPLEIYLLHNRTSPLKKGCFNYIPQDHQLKHLSSSYNESQLLSSFLDEDREAISNVSTVFLIFADYSRTTYRYGDRGVQYVHLEVGHAIQNFLLQLTSLNLNTRIIIDFNSLRLQNCINTMLDPMVVLPVGIDGGSFSSFLRFKTKSTNNTEEMTVEQAIVKRKSTRDYIDGNIPLTVISEILNDSIRIPYLSNGNLHLDLRLVVGEVEELITGSYRFFIANNSLKGLTLEDLRLALRKAGLNQTMIERAQLDIVISVNTTWIDEQSDPSHFHRVMMYNIGMLAQNVYLKCASYGLGTVVVGALHQVQTAQVIDLSATYTPIYIIPIGLTPEFFEGKIVGFVPLTDFARISGILVYIPFYISLYLSLPVLRRRMTKKMRWIHCIIGFIPVFGVMFHFSIIHGYIRDLWDIININICFNAISGFITRIFSFPTTRYDIGIYLANLNILLGVVALTTGILFAFKLVRQRKLVRRIHKYCIFCIILFMIIHALLNRTMFVSKPLIFLSLNIIFVALFFLLYISPKIAKDIKKQESITSVSQEE
ncbi:MAG: SagB family peptide dehydrogenase [Candidatus Thorarchaeota archaeon]